MKQRIILASISQRRKELARAMGLEFTIMASNFNEDILQSKHMDAKELVMDFAYGKAFDVAKRLKNGIVIGCDTVVVHNNKIIGKPKNAREAYRILKSYSGKHNEVYSGFCLIDSESHRLIKDFEITKVYYRKLSDLEIKTYVNTGISLDRAGAIETNLGSIFVRKIDGCYFNVMGFPIHKIYLSLKKMGVNIFEYPNWKRKYGREDFR